MAGGRSDSIRSFKNIPSIISAQRNAADSAGAIFWDSWNAMGGESSIISWAGKNPPLAQKDLVHLTYDGADTLASIMAESLFFSYDKHPGFADDTIEKVETFIPEEELRDERGKIQVLISSVFSYDPDDPMIFTTAAFWLFLLIVMIFYSLLYKKLVLRNFYLFLISLFFYYKSGGLFLGLLILVTVIDFVNGLIIGTSGKKSVRKLFIVLSILSNIGILGYFKYSVFIADSLNSLLGTEIKAHDFLADLSNLYLGTGFNVSNIILPVGISFFTFQSLSYTIDVYRRKISPVRNIIDFGFFVSFFPQLVAGPIVRASEFVPQIYAPYHLGKREFSHAAFLICKGLIKKIIISDFISVNFIDRVFDAPSMYSGFENIMAVYGYGLQIYCDFSGYTDIAIGVGLLFGFRLPLNFNSPYKAAGISDFWRRWHISLSRWLKDYLYIPLGGNRKGKIRTYINLILTMTIGGLWHGANLRFVIWGFLHGIGLIFDRLVKNIYGNRSRGRLVSFLGIFLTFNFVNFCWIFFRAADLENVRIMISQMIHSFSPGSWGVALLTYSNVFLLILAGYVLHFIPEDVKESYRGLFIRVPIAAQMVVILFVAVLLYRMSSADTMPFIYFRF
jgi:D-alanyl-lipoteichoic acid acyltransferase DltB (MBOAT superfamily)